jgi:hypothetical protein
MPKNLLPEKAAVELEFCQALQAADARCCLALPLSLGQQLIELGDSANRVVAKVESAKMG